MFENEKTPDTVDTFTRQDLWMLNAKAWAGHNSCLNPEWQKAYRELAYAASVLDAFLARSSVGVPPIQPTPESSVVAG